MKAIEIENMQRKERFTKEISDAIRITVDTALEHCGADDVELSVSIVSSQRMRALNKAERGIDSDTDVLAFPFIDWTGKEPGNLDNVRDQLEKNMDTGLYMLGAVVISMPRALRQAEEIGNTLLEELAFLSLHGTLHLLGFDHTDQDSEKVMTQLQREIIKKALWQGGRD